MGATQRQFHRLWDRSPVLGTHACRHPKIKHRRLALGTARPRVSNLLWTQGAELEPERVYEHPFSRNTCFGLRAKSHP